MMLKLYILPILILISLHDLNFRKIPNTLLYGLFVMAFTSDISADFYNIPLKILAGLFFTGLLAAIAKFSKGLGFGDVKLIGILGYCCGFFQTLLICIMACIMGIMASLILYRLNEKKQRNPIPFAPFLTAGYAISEVIGGWLR